MIVVVGVTMLVKVEGLDDGWLDVDLEVEGWYL